MNPASHDPLNGSDDFGRLAREGVEGVVLLGGTVRQTDFRRGIGRHILQLPVDDERIVLSRWVEQTAALAKRLGAPSMKLRILLSPDEHFAPEQVAHPVTKLSVESDPNPTRGTGGVLRDLVEHIPGSKWLIIANANQAFIGDTVSAIARLAATRADMALMPAHDGNGGFLLLARCECFKGIAPRGFVDLKEQALPAIAEKFDVRVVDAHPELTPTSIRSLQDYLDMLHALARVKAIADANGQAPRFEEWSLMFKIIETGGTVANGARIHNSVVLRGATVGSGAVVARCVVGPGGKVDAREVVRDKFVTPAGEEASQ